MSGALGTAVGSVDKSVSLVIFKRAGRFIAIVIRQNVCHSTADYRCSNVRAGSSGWPVDLLFSKDLRFVLILHSSTSDDSYLTNKMQREKPFRDYIDPTGRELSGKSSRILRRAEYFVEMLRY